MKKVIILLGVLASITLTACATKVQTAPATDTTTHCTAKHHHHDYKGER